MEVMNSAVLECWRSLAVDGGGDVQRRGIGDLVGRDDAGAHGSEAVQALAEVPLFVAGLHVPGGDIVENGVAEDVVPGVGSPRIFRAVLPRITASSAS